VHPHGEITALYIGRADMLWIGRTDLGLLNSTDTFCGAVARLRLRIGTIDFHQHGIVNLIGERRFNGLQIGSVSIAS
jgi:hypothetical protein